MSSTNPKMMLLPVSASGASESVRELNFVATPRSRRGQLTRRRRGGTKVCALVAQASCNPLQGRQESVSGRQRNCHPALNRQLVQIGQCLARGITLRSTGPATAGVVRLVCSTLCIVTNQPYATHRSRPVNSNVRQRNDRNVERQHSQRLPA